MCKIVNTTVYVGCAYWFLFASLRVFLMAMFLWMILTKIPHRHENLKGSALHEESVVVG